MHPSVCAPKGSRGRSAARAKMARAKGSGLRVAPGASRWWGDHPVSSLRFPQQVAGFLYQVELCDVRKNPQAKTVDLWSVVRSLDQRDAVGPEDRSELRAAAKFSAESGGELRDGTVVDCHVFVAVQPGRIPEAVNPVGALICG
jgi:hypothetical protein